MLKLKLQYFGHLMRRVDSSEKTLMLGRLKVRGERDNRGWDGWMESLTQWTWVWVDSSSWWWTGRPGMLRSLGLQRVRHDWVTELNWTELCTRGFPGGSVVKNYLPMQKTQETWVQSLGQEDPLEEEMAIPLQYSLLSEPPGKQSVLKEINPEYSLERLLLKLKHQYFGHLMWRAGLIGKARKDWGQEEKGTTEGEMVGWRHQLNGHEFE